MLLKLDVHQFQLLGMLEGLLAHLATYTALTMNSAATDDTKAVGQAAEIKAGNAIGTTEGVAASAADSAAGTTEAAGTATAEKAKKHHRPKIDHHEST